MYLALADRLKRKRQKLPVRRLLKGGHWGHLIANLLGGCSCRCNVCPMPSFINLSVYRKIENEISALLKAGKNVCVQVDVIYSDSSLVPTKFCFQYWEQHSSTSYAYVILNDGSYYKNRAPPRRIVIPRY